MSKRYTTLPSISAEISAFVELCVINNPSSSDKSIVFLNPGIYVEISAFVELCVINNRSSSDESIVFLNPGSHWVKWLTSLAYKVCKFEVLHALHELILSLE